MSKSTHLIAVILIARKCPAHTLVAERNNLFVLVVVGKVNFQKILSKDILQNGTFTYQKNINKHNTVMKETMEQTLDRYYRNEFYKGECIPPIEEAIEVAKEQGVSLERIQVARKSDITDAVIGKPVSEVIGYLQTLRQEAILSSYNEDEDYSFDYDEGLNVIFMSDENDYEYGSRIGRLLGKTMRSHIREINKKQADREKRKAKIQKMEKQLAQLKQEDAEDKDE